MFCAEPDYFLGCKDLGISSFLRKFVVRMY